MELIGIGQKENFMKKINIILIGLGIILSFGGCAPHQNSKAIDSTTQAVATLPSPPTQASENTVETQSTIKTSISGIQLGDRIDNLKEKFGAAIKEVPLEQPSYYGQNVSQIAYPNGVSLFLDKDTNTILEITIEEGTFETNLGVKLGDSAEDVLKKYGATYKLFKGDNSEDYLQGWYVVEEGELLIFDFKKGDNTHYNGKINSSDKVVSITLSHPKYFD